MNHLKSFGGKVSLPRELSKIIHPETKTKDGSFNLLSAFQGLSFGTVAFTGGKNGKTSTPRPARGDTCKVMWAICDCRDSQPAAVWLLVAKNCRETAGEISSYMIAACTQTNHQGCQGNTIKCKKWIGPCQCFTVKCDVFGLILQLH